MPDLSIAIVSYNTKDVLKRNLEQIFLNNCGINYEVAVTDNNSNDGSPEMIKSLFPIVKLIENKTNLYFTKAINQAIRAGSGRYMLILNPDIFIKKDVFKAMIKFLDTHPGIGALGCKILSPDGKIENCASEFLSFKVALLSWTFLGKIFKRQLENINRKFRYEDWDRKSAREVDVLVDACLMVRRECLDKVGLYDENCRLYYTENDLCKKIKDSGFQIYYYPDVEVMHMGQQSVNKEKKNKIYNIRFKDAFSYSRKHFKPSEFLVLSVFMSINKIGRVLFRYFN